METLPTVIVEALTPGLGFSGPVDPETDVVVGADVEELDELDDVVVEVLPETPLPQAAVTRASATSATQRTRPLLATDLAPPREPPRPDGQGAVGAQVLLPAEE